MSPIQNVHFECPAAGVSCSSRRCALWAALACGLLAAASLAGADDKKAGSSRGNVSEDLVIGGQLKEAFDVGFQVGPRSIQQAQERLVRVRKLAPDDARIDYAHGLVLVRQSQIKLAIVQFEAAVAQDGPPFWPAWKAAIWSQCIDNRFEAGLNRLVEFAMLVHDYRPDDPTQLDGGAADGLPDDEREVSEVQRETARWIGQLLEALTQLPAAQKHKALIADRESRTVDALGEELALSVDDGRELLRARAQELGLAADVARDTAGQLAKRKKLDKELDAITKDKGATPQTPEEWKKWIDDVLSQFDKQLGQMDRDFQTLQQRTDSLSASYMQANAQLVATKTRMTVAHHTVGGHFSMPFLKDQLVACNDQMTAYQVEYDVVSGQMSNVAQRAAGIANRRAAAIARYEKETGDTIKKNPDFDKWATWLNTKRPKLATKSANKKGASDKADVAKKRAPTLKSLMPLDLEHERDDVLASFGLRPTVPTDPSDGPDPGEKPEAKSGQRSAAPAAQK